MNNNIFPQAEEQVIKLKREVQIDSEELNRLLADRKRLMEKVEEYNSKAVMCIAAQKWESGLVYLSEAESLLQFAAAKGYLIDRCLVQCILHNQANCYQNLWQLDQCSNYIEALIFNINSRNKSQRSSPEIHNITKDQNYNKLGLAQYYLQFCAINSQLSNHSGALISARKALQLIKAQLREWRRQLQSRQKAKNKIEYDQKIRLLNLICSFNDNINIHMQEALLQATIYYLKMWKINSSNPKSMIKDIRDYVDSFTIKSVMQIHYLQFQVCTQIFEKEVEMTLLNLFERVFIISTCYFTMATQLRLISLKKSRESNSDKYQLPQYKESQIYHLLAILVLALALSLSSPFLNHLLISYQNHYNSDLFSKDIPFKKIFNQIIFVKEQCKVREQSIQFSEQDQGFPSHISKPGRTMIRITKSSKQSQRQNKFSLIDPKGKKSKSKNQKGKSKSKKESVSNNKKNPRPSVSKSPHSKTPRPKQSILIKSPKSKESLPFKSPLHSLKHISSPMKIKVTPLNSKNNIQKQKGASKSKRKTKIDDPHIDQYFLAKRAQDKRPKKTSVSSKKNQSQSRSTGRLPINSTLQTKPLISGTNEKKKTTKRSILQHYL